MRREAPCPSDLAGGFHSRTTKLERPRTALRPIPPLAGGLAGSLLSSGSKRPPAGTSPQGGSWHVNLRLGGASYAWRCRSPGRDTRDNIYAAPPVPDYKTLPVLVTTTPSRQRGAKPTCSIHEGSTRCCSLVSASTWMQHTAEYPFQQSPITMYSRNKFLDTLYIFLDTLYSITCKCSVLAPSPPLKPMEIE